MFRETTQIKNNYQTSLRFRFCGNVRNLNYNLVRRVLFGRAYGLAPSRLCNQTEQHGNTIR